MNELIEYVQVLEEMAKRESQRKLFTYYPDTGPLRRELYPKHTHYFRLGVTHSIRAFVAANRVGKTEGVGGYETTLHLTGRYPAWWDGTCFTGPIRAWVAGDTSKTVREITQEKLLGPYGHFGTGLIPGEDIIKWTPKTGVPEAVDTLLVKHYDEHGKQDGESRLVFKSYDQKRESFQGTEQELIWLDEEAPADIRGECIIRLMTTDGLLIETFTPLMGLTKTVMQYLPNGETPVDGDAQISEDRALVMAGWTDVPHLSEEQTRKMLAECEPHLRDARSKGIPSLGSGAIYPVPETDIVVADFPIPAHWPRLYALDVGWNRTAAIWGAWDRDTDVIYLYAEHYRGQAEPSIHAHAIKARGEWINGEIDPASRGRSQKDGEQLMQNYKDLGLKVKPAINAVESGIYEVWQRLSTGRLKVFQSLGNWKSEYRIYRRDEKGRIVKENDHLMDCTKYLCAAPAEHWKVKQLDRAAVVLPFQQHISGMGMLG